MKEKYIHRIGIVCTYGVVEALRDIAAGACAAVFPSEDPESQRGAFVPVARADDGSVLLYGLDLAATESLRSDLSARLASAIAGGDVSGPVAIRRMDATSGTLAGEPGGGPAAYVIGPGGSVAIDSPGVDREWLFVDFVKASRVAILGG